VQGEKAAWFLKNRTYVDDATGGAHYKENAVRIYEDMECNRMRLLVQRNGHDW
jgi:hypothetical protein